VCVCVCEPKNSSYPRPVFLIANQCFSPVKRLGTLVSIHA